MFMDQVDRMDLMDKMGAPVFALTGYAVASLGIARGLAVPRWGGRRGQMCRRGKQNKSGGETRRVSRRSHG